MKNLAWILVLGPFEFSENPMYKGIYEVCVLIWTNFDSFTDTYLI